jgi:L-aspartate oxidase
MKTHSDKNFDVIILGTGVAGASLALELSAHCKVALMTREEDPSHSNTYYAQGGIIYSKDKNDYDLLIQDILKASAGTSHLPAVKQLAKHSGKILESILIQRAQTDFARDEKGDLLFTREAAHSSSRIIYKGDYTGKAIELSLIHDVLDKEKNPNITLFTQHTAIDLITPNHHGKSMKQRYETNRVVGVYVYDQVHQLVKKIMGKIVVLATGGIGAMYLHHSNSEGARGDGQAMAKRAGAALMDMEFIQFHPTTFFDRSSHRRFLISEAVRGEGGVLLNAKGEKFMKRYHPDGELAPRDVVARAILKEMVQTKHDCVYLDISFKESHWIQERFPTIYRHCLEKGVHIDQGPIPVVPAAHYTCGGVKTSLKGETNVPCLYAIGEVACTGLHGANRLASTSLLEGITWAHMAAQSIIGRLNSIPLYNAHHINDWDLAQGVCELDLVHQDLVGLKQTMWNYVGPIRSKNRLQRAQVMITQLRDEVEKFYKNVHLCDELIGLRNSLEVALTVVKASGRNKKSIGCFYLEDQEHGSLS